MPEEPTIKLKETRFKLDGELAEAWMRVSDLKDMFTITDWDNCKIAMKNIDYRDKLS